MGNSKVRAAVFYHPEAYTTSGPRLMGRHSAGESFLRGWLLYGQTDEFWAQVHDASHAQLFAAYVRKLGRSEPVKVVDRRSIGDLKQAGTLFFPSPTITDLAWQRSFYGDRAWSLCGITHTTASAAVMDTVANFLVAPLQPWDAIICTSHAVRDNLLKILQAQADYLSRRLGIRRLVLPQLPVIPLGVHMGDFQFSPQQRKKARDHIKADDKTHVVLFMGRLSFHAKAHPLAMYQALEQASRKLPRDEEVLLVECGWFANEGIERSFHEAAAVAAPSIKIVRLDGRHAEQREIAWASADIFCSLSDNIQETFGLTPVEAMAAGLPSVVSDWDGYKESVRDGIDGFRIPTLMPGGGLGGDLAMRHALEIDSYDMYCGYTSSMVAVDIDKAAEAFSRLFGSAELRKRMGQAAKERVKEVFDWSVIIPRYETLWEELGRMRQERSAESTGAAQPWPARLDPFFAFSGYPSITLQMQTQVGLREANVQVAREKLETYLNLGMVNYLLAILPSKSELERMLEIAASGPVPAIHLVAWAEESRRGYLFRMIAWLCKLGILKTF
ncbi:MAG: glycosyltransferase family 4 protein [Campylobacterales bacterium]